MSQYVFSNEQREFRQVLDDFLGRHADPLATYNGASTGDVWGGLIQLGLGDLLVTDDDVTHVALVSEALARSVAPVPFLGLTLATRVLRDVAPLELEVLGERIAAGDVRPVLAIHADATDPVLPIVEIGTDGTAEASCLVDAVDATHLVIRTADDVLAVVNQFEISRLESIDWTRPFARVRFPVTAVREIARGPQVEPSLQSASRVLLTMLAFEGAGVAQAALEGSSAYSKTRQQFGHPIGLFQATKHRLAGMLVDTELARSAAYGAAWTDLSSPASSSQASLAKAVSTENAIHVCNEAVQLHGAVGVTWELPLHPYLRRAKTIEHLGGRPGIHWERIASSLLAGSLDRQSTTGGGE